MASDEFGDKTELPTDRRRAEAREKGNVARSTDLNAAGHMVAAAAIFFFFGWPLTQSMAELLRSHLAGPGWIQIDTGLVVRHSFDIAKWMLHAMFPVILATVVGALAVNLAQVGFLVAPEALEPKLSRLNPIEGAKRILSVQALAKLAASLAKIVVLVTLAVWYSMAQLPQFLQLIDAETATIASCIGRTIVELSALLAFALIVLALLDYVFQKWKFEQDLKMSKQEVREEMKNMEGDPHIRQRRRDAHRKLAQARELQQVPHADVVITNPTHIAVAIKYDPETTSAPVVIAKGMGEIAHRIRRIAIENNIPVIERKPLARALYRDVKVGQDIPVEMYEVFVEIMAYVYRITGRTPTGLK